MANSGILGVLLAQHSTTGMMVYQFLTLNDILGLMTLSKRMYRVLTENNQLLNWVFYDRRLNITRALSLDLPSYGIENKQHNQRAWATCGIEHLDFRNQIESLRNLQIATLEVLRYVPLLDSKLTLRQLNRVFVDPQPPKPIMRRKAVGKHCKSSIQIKMAIQGNSSVQDPYLSQQDQILKRFILENADAVLDCLISPSNTNLAFSIRYQGELLSVFRFSRCTVVDLVQLVLLFTGNLVSSIRVYLESITTLMSSVEFLQEFLLRYNLFKSSVSQLNEKYQFLFQTFEQGFHQVFPNHPTSPRFSVWRLMMKQWINHMVQFQELLNRCSLEVFITVVQDSLQAKMASMMSEPASCPQFNAQFQKQKFKAPKPIANNVTQVSRQVLSILHQQLVEFVVDVSCNTHSIHWLGSSKLRLGRWYRSLQSLILKTVEDYLKQITDSFSNGTVKLKLFKFFIQSTVQLLKPATNNKVQKLYRDFLEQIAERPQKTGEDFAFVQELKLGMVDYQHDDHAIEQMNRRRDLSQETGQLFQMFLGLDEKVSLEAVATLSEQTRLRMPSSIQS